MKFLGGLLLYFAALPVAMTVLALAFFVGLKLAILILSLAVAVFGGA